MARPRSEDKREAIARATIDEVVAVGFASASIERIARRADLAVGTVYRYYESREGLLREVHLDVKRALHERLMRAAAGAATPRGRIEAAWLALLDAAVERPAAFRFAEAVAAQDTLSDAERAALAAMDAEVQALLDGAIAAGAIAPLPPAALRALLVAPPMRLARDAAASGVAPPRALAREVFARIWRGLRSDNE